MHPIDLPHLHARVLRWYDDHRRTLPWRHPRAGAWAVLVSEVMLQQTPVARVLPAYDAWMARWPKPSSLAAEQPGEAVRMWGRLGYPRRALRLHAAATIIDRDHADELPASYAELRALPGVGDYTANAVLAFAYRQRAPVLDTNVRRVHARIINGTEFPPEAVTAAERGTAEALLPADADTAATWSVAVMELGALVCQARSPRCTTCPVAELCAWRADGFPQHNGPPRRGQSYAGTDRQCRGRILGLLRDNEEPVDPAVSETVWSDAEQRARSLQSLLDDGLVVRLSDGRLSLP